MPKGYFVEEGGCEEEVFGTLLPLMLGDDDDVGCGSKVPAP